MGYKLILSKTLLRLHKIFYTPSNYIVPKTVDTLTFNSPPILTGSTSLRLAVTVMLRSAKRGLRSAARGMP